MTEEIQAPEGPIKDFFNGLIQKFLKSQINSTNVKKFVFAILENAEALASTTTNAFDDYTVNLVKRELEDNWDRWFSWVAVRIGLIAVPQSIEDLGEESFSMTGTCVDSEEVLAPEAVTPEISVEIVITILNLIIPRLWQWFNSKSE